MLENDPNKLITLTAEAVSEMTVWWGFLDDPNPWIPICNPRQTTHPFALKLSLLTPLVVPETVHGQEKPVAE